MTAENEDLYEILGVDHDAGKDEIKAAYRKLAAKHHPDKNGGKHSEQFYKVQMAYEILSDDESRRSYDADGTTTRDSLEFKAHLHFVETFCRIFAEMAEDADIMRIIEATIKSDIAALRAFNKAIEKNIRKMEAMIKRIKTRGEHNLIKQTFEFNIREFKKRISQNDARRELLEKALEYTESYSVEQMLRLPLGGNMPNTEKAFRDFLRGEPLY